MARKSGRVGEAASPRRAPAAEDRQLDADRSRKQLLAAALEEFAAKGFAGARVQDIADRAEMNKQLINYYFGGKEGLYHELLRTWLARKASFADPELGLDELIVRYLHDALRDPRQMRLVMWRGLTDGPEQVPEDPAGDEHPTMQDLARIRRRQSDGELSSDLDPGAVLLVLMGAIAAPIAMPQLVSRIFGLDVAAPEFELRYGEQLRRIVRHLAR